MKLIFNEVRYEYDIRGLITSFFPGTAVETKAADQQEEKENQDALILENQPDLVCPNFYNVVIEFSYTVHIVNSLRHINRVKRMALDAACHKQRQQHEREQRGVVETRIVERKSVKHLVYVNQEVIARRKDVGEDCDASIHVFQRE